MLGTGTAKIFWSSFKTYALGGGQGNSLTPGTGIVGRIRNHLRIDASYPARWIQSQGLPMDSNCLTILKWQWCWAIYTCIDVYFQSTYIYIYICIYVYSALFNRQDWYDQLGRCRQIHFLVRFAWHFSAKDIIFCPNNPDKTGKKLTYGFVLSEK